MKLTLSALCSFLQFNFNPFCFCIIVLIGFIVSETQAIGADNKTANDPAHLLFTQYCLKCHSGAKPKGDFLIESLSPDFANRKNREQWLTVLDQLRKGDMPPKDKPQPPATEVQAVD